MLCVLIRSASSRRFLWVPTTYVFYGETWKSYPTILTKYSSLTSTLINYHDDYSNNEIENLGERF